MISMAGTAYKRLPPTFPSLSRLPSQSLLCKSLQPITRLQCISKASPKHLITLVTLPMHSYQIIFTGMIGLFSLASTTYSQQTYTNCNLLTQELGTVYADPDLKGDSQHVYNGCQNIKSNLAKKISSYSLLRDNDNSRYGCCLFFPAADCIGSPFPLHRGVTKNWISTNGENDAVASALCYLYPM